jgi:hypothetical protein
MTPSAFLAAPAWLVSDANCRPVSLRTEEHFDLDLLPNGWSVQKSTMAEGIAAIVAEDVRRRAAR